MSDAQLIVIVGAAVALAVLVLVVVLAARRGRRDHDEEPTGSFLDARPQDTFAGLGEPEGPVGATDDEFRLDWGHGDEESGPPRDAGVKTVRPTAALGGTGTAFETLQTETILETETAGREGPARDEGPARETAAKGTPARATEAGRAEERPAARPERETEAVDAEEPPPAGHAEEQSPAGPETETEAGGAEERSPSGAGGAPAEEPEAIAAEEGPAEGSGETLAADESGGAEGSAETSAADEAGAAEIAPEPRAPRMVPLSDIIVTTSRKTVDLDDPEVRRMLTELVRYEIDQAAEFSAAGQSVDAVLQLTEAEKVSRALGMDETAERIKAVMRDLHV